MTQNGQVAPSRRDLGIRWRRTSDVDEIEQAVAGIALQVRRLTTTRGDVGVASAELDDVALSAGDFGFRVATEGEMSADGVVVALQLDDGAGAWDGFDFASDRAWVYGPRSEHFGVGGSGRAGPPRFATLSIPFRRAPESFREAGVGRRRMLTSREVPRLRALMLDALGASASVGAHSRAIRRDLLDSVERLDDSLVASGLDRVSAADIVDQCRSLAKELPSMPAASDFAPTLGVSERWIRAAFREICGVSISTYFRSVALRGARDDLRAGSPATTSVTEVAMRWGFWHLGRFSGTYARHHGELPRDTLRRPADCTSRIG